MNFNNTPTGVVKSILSSVKSIFENLKLSKLRKLKKETNGLGGKGKLIAKLIDELSVFYGLAIRKNKDSVKDMKMAIWATLKHKSSTDTNPQHDAVRLGMTAGVPGRRRRLRVNWPNIHVNRHSAMTC